MEYLNLPDRGYIRSLPRNAFLTALEQTMLAAHQGLVLQREAGKSAGEMVDGALLHLGPLPNKTAAYDPEHKKYSDHMSSVSTWLNHTDRDDVEREAGLAEERRARFKKVIPDVDDAEHNRSDLKERRRKEEETHIPELSVLFEDIRTPTNGAEERRRKNDRGNDPELPALLQNLRTPTMAAKLFSTPSPFAKSNGKSIAKPSPSALVTPSTPPNRSRHSHRFLDIFNKVGSPAKKLKSKHGDDEEVLFSFAAQEPGVYTPLRKAAEKSAKLAATAKWVKQSSMANPEGVLERGDVLNADTVKEPPQMAGDAHASASGAENTKVSIKPEVEKRLNPLAEPILLSSPSSSSSPTSSSSSVPDSLPGHDKMDQVRIRAELEVLPATLD